MEEVETLLDDVLADDLKNLVLLKSLTGDVQRQVFRVDNTLDEVEVLGNNILTVIHDEDTADIELDVVALLLRLEEIEWSTKSKLEFKNKATRTFYIPFWHIEDSIKPKLTLNGEVLDGEVVLPVVGQALVERRILLLGDVLRVARPDRLRLVELLGRDLLLLDLLGLLLLGLVLVLDFLDLGLVLLLVLGNFLVVLNLL